MTITPILSSKPIIFYPSEYKNYQPKFVPTDSSSSVAFVQKTKSNSRISEKVKDVSWVLKQGTCHECDEIGHICPQCPLLQGGDDKQEDSASKFKSKKISQPRRKVRRQLSLRPKRLNLTTRMSPATNLQATDLLTSDSNILPLLPLLRWISAT